MGILLTAVQRFLTPELIGRLASAVGIDAKMAQGAASAAIPTIMSGLAQVAGTAGGAERLASTMGKMSSGSLDNFTSRLGNPGELMQQGQSMMSSLLGGSATTALTSTLAKFAGSGEGATRSLLGLLMPAILGVLGRHQQTTGGTSASLARQLQSESSDFRAAMPSGLASLLDSSGVFNRMGETGPAAARPTAATTATTTSAAARGADRDLTARATPPPPRPAETAGRSWAYWAIPLSLVIGGLIGYALHGGRQPEVQVGQPATAIRTTDLASALPLNSYIRAPLNSQSGEALGTVENVLVMPDGRVVAVVSVERALGIGERRVAVPLSDITSSARDGGSQLVLKGSRDELTRAPLLGEGGGAGGAPSAAPPAQLSPGAQPPSPNTQTPPQ